MVTARMVRVVAFGLLVLVVLTSTLEPLDDPDSWWNLLAGQTWLATGAEVDVHAFGDHGCLSPNAQHHVLGQVALAVAHRAFGLWGLLLRRISVIALLAVLCFTMLRRRTGTIDASLYAAVVVVAASVRFGVRPELFSLLLFTAVGVLVLGLLGPDVAKRAVIVRLAFLVAIMAAWVHIHSGYIVALAWVLPACAGSVLARGDRAAFVRATLVATVVAAAVAAQPASWSVLGSAAAERAVGEAIGIIEWWPLWTHIRLGWRDGALAGLGALLAASAVCVLATKRRRALLPTLLPALSTWTLAFAVSRNVAFGAVGGAFLLCQMPDLPTRTRKLLRALALVSIVVGVLSFKPSFVIDGVGDAQGLVATEGTPIFIEQHLRSQGARGLVFAPLGPSNWFLKPPRSDLRVTWSGRRTYTLECGRELWHARRFPEKSFAVVDDRLHPDYVVVELAHEARLFSHLVAHGFVLADYDLRFALFLRPGSSVVPFTLEVERLVEQERPRLRGERAAQVLAHAGRVLVVAGRLRDAHALWGRA